jgi:hypothetical protein
MRKYSDVRYIYIIRSGDYAKVGMSRAPDKRMKQLDRGLAHRPTLVATFVAWTGLEFRLHRYLLEHHARHEWFRWCDKLDDIVAYGIPACLESMPRGSPFHPNRGGRKPRMVSAEAS